MKTKLWVRALPDGRAIIFGTLPVNPLPADAAEGEFETTLDLLSVAPEAKSRFIKPMLEFDYCPDCGLCPNGCEREGCGKKA